MQGCWLAAASRAQAAFAALADRLLRRARYKTPPKAEVGKSSIWAEVSKSTSAANAGGDRARLHLAAECTNLDRPGAAACRY